MRTDQPPNDRPTSQKTWLEEKLLGDKWFHSGAGELIDNAEKPTHGAEHSLSGALGR